MFVEEINVSIVDALCYFFTNLVGRTALDHVITCPSVFGFGAGGL